MTRNQRAVDRLAAQRIDGVIPPGRGARPDVVEWLVDAPVRPPDRERLPGRGGRRPLRAVAAGGVVVAVVVGALFVSGVLTPSPTSPAPPTDTTSRPLSAHAAPSLCQRLGSDDPATRAALPTTRLSTTFVPTAVVQCGWGSRTNADGSEDSLGVEKRTTDPVVLARLVAALRLPDEQRSDGPCTLGLSVTPNFLLVDRSGAVDRPRVPRGRCGDPRTEVTSALLALRGVTVATWVTGRTRSAESARTGCAMQGPDLGKLDLVPGKPARAELTADPLPTGASIRVCLYTVPATGPDSTEAGAAFSHGAVLTIAQRGTLEALLSSAPPAGACTRPATRLAVVEQTAVRGPQVVVELDGCRHLRAETRTGVVLVQPAAALLRFLAGV